MALTLISRIGPGCPDTGPSRRRSRPAPLGGPPPRLALRATGRRVGVYDEQVRGRLVRQGSDLEAVDVVIPQVVLADSAAGADWSGDRYRLDRLRYKASLADAADEAPLTIAGTITLDGRPLDDGIIVFHLDDGEFVGAKVKDGAYKLTRVPAGDWKISLGGEGVPAKYTTEETSGLRVAVKPGGNTINFELVK